MLESEEPGCWLHYTGCRDDCEYCVNFANCPEDWKEVVESLMLYDVILHYIT